MIAVLKSGVTHEQIDNLIEWFKEQGLKVHLSEGDYKTILGLIGDTTKIDIEVDIDEVITDLNSKANDSDVVHKTGNETITGTKTFQNTNLYQSTTATSSGSYVDFVQNINGARRGTIRTTYNSDGSYQVTLGCNGPDAAAPSGLVVKRTSSAITATAPTPAVSNNSTEIATTAYVNTKVQQVSALPASPNSNVFYFIPE